MLRALVPIVAVPVCWALLRCSDTATVQWSPLDRAAQPALPVPGMAPAFARGTDGPLGLDVARPDAVLPGEPAPGDATLVTEVAPALDAGTRGPADPDAAAPEPAPAEPISSEPVSSEPARAGALPEENFPTPILPSAGCERNDPVPAQGLASILLGKVPADYLLSLPDGYDGSQPVPLIFAFHGRARTYLEFASEDATEIDRLASRALMVYPQSQGGEGWTHEGELAPNLEFFEALYAQVLANYCVNSARVFAVGHSSGGFFSHILACRYGDRLRGIGVVAGAQEETECSGYVAALLIHGVRDAVVEFTRGEAARDSYLARNGCSAESWTAAVEPCRSYTDCEAGLPVAWCTHDEPTYDDTNHGWPSFASRAIADFLFALP